jgi:hypothetical protein
MNRMTKSTVLRSTNDRDNGFVVALDRRIRRHTADRSERWMGRPGSMRGGADGEVAEETVAKTHTSVAILAPVSPYA